MQDSLPASVYHKSRTALSTVHQMLTQLSSDCELVVAETNNQLNKTSDSVAKDKWHFNNTVKVVTPCMYTPSFITTTHSFLSVRDYPSSQRPDISKKGNSEP